MKAASGGGLFDRRLIFRSGNDTHLAHVRQALNFVRDALSFLRSNARQNERHLVYVGPFLRMHDEAFYLACANADRLFDEVWGQCTMRGFNDEATALIASAVDFFERLTPAKMARIAAVDTTAAK